MLPGKRLWAVSSSHSSLRSSELNNSVTGVDIFLTPEEAGLVGEDLYLDPESGLYLGM